MLITEMIGKTADTYRPEDGPNCDYCGTSPAVIKASGYGDDEIGDCNWCADCALQLAREILEDLCELRIKGGRHG